MLAFEVVKSGDSAFLALARAKQKKGGQGASRVEHARESSRAE